VAASLALVELFFVHVPELAHVLFLNHRVSTHHRRCMQNGKSPLIFGLVASSLALGCNDEGTSSYGKSTQTQLVDDAGNPVPSSCTAEELGDDAPVATAINHSIWPPNHKLHYFSVSDCATALNACGEAVRGEFTWGSSDEPVNDIGDGNHEPDIIFGDCERVGVRSERQGPRDGRVYKLGVRFVDIAGNTTDTECAIIVDHDQRGLEAEDSGESYRIGLDGTGGTPVCDGVTDPPAEQDAGTPGDGDGDGDAPGDGDGDGDAPGDGDGDGDGDSDVPPGDGDGDDGEPPPI
jgi:hypothetical protein